MGLTRYQKHKAKWITCQRCDLHKTRRKVVLCRGKLPCDVLFIGEAPGKSENAIGSPFVGPAGHLQNYIIERALDGQFDYALINLVGCIPVDEEGAKFGQPPPEAIKACRPRLVEIVDIAQPKLIVQTGELAKRYATAKKLAYSKAQFLSVVHPAFILRLDVSQKGLAIQRVIVAIESALADW